MRRFYKWDWHEVYLVTTKIKAAPANQLLEKRGILFIEDTHNCLTKNADMKGGRLKLTNQICRLMTELVAHPTGYEFFAASASELRFAKPSITAFNEPLV